MKNRKPTCVLRGLACGTIAAILSGCQNPAITNPDLAMSGDGMYGPDMALPRDMAMPRDTAMPADMTKHFGFRASLPFTVGWHAQVVATGDLNRDGHADIVTAENFDNNHNASVLLGKGDGTFQGALYTVLSQEPDPFGLVVADFDGDGRPDIATANQDQGDIGVLLGKADGTFNTAQNFKVPVDRGLAVGDLQGNGKLDLCNIGGGVNRLRGNGDGTFQAAEALAGTAGATAVIIGDADSDGKQDVIAALKDGMVVLRGKGDGSLQAGVVSSPAGASARGLALADLNGDGKPDVVLAGNTVVVVCMGQGDGTFASCASFPAEVSTGNPVGGPLVAIADFDRDGHADIAVTGYQTVSILLGDGRGSFAAAVSFDTFGAYDGASGLVVNDFNGDGLPDIAVAGQSGEVGVLLNTSG